MTSSVIAFGQGDVYCPRCWTGRLDMTVMGENMLWDCSCGWHASWDEWTFDPSIPDWVWPDGLKPNPGCPWCSSCNILVQDLPPRESSSDPFHWQCQRGLCGKKWRGSFRLFEDGSMRWLIRLARQEIGAV